MGIGEFYSVACALAWAIAVILFKRSGETMPPMALNLFKNVLMLVLLGLTALVLVREVPSLPQAAIWICLISGVIGIGFGDTLYLSALNRLGAARTGVAGMLYSPFVVLLSIPFLGERMVALQWLGFGLVLLGLTAVNWPGRVRLEQVGAPLGLAFAALSMLANALSIVMVKPLLESENFFWVVTLRMLGGTLSMLIYLLLTRALQPTLAHYGRPHHWPTLFAGAFIGSYIAMLLWLAGYKYAPASIASILNESASLFILLLAWWLLDERFARRQWWGSALAFVGLGFVITA